ncbi:DNA-directed RNA polymerase III subunit RPC7 isoform X2 [Tamandua tetradactyla]|uniref:DNA-directed RNA polymerase III subunit RPC7 isoform X2 n=1 Tax=Tamandua tetradactyla TaxID=48850 RepID=UPI0040544F2B
MAGNKGRGRAAYTFNIEAVGFTRGEKLPDVVLKPPPLFPDIDYKPVPLKTGEDEDYMLALKQELRETMKRMPFFIETPEEKQGQRGENTVGEGLTVSDWKWEVVLEGKNPNLDIERYSKRYMKVYKEEWVPDWRRLPREMMPRKKCKKDPKSKKAKDTGKVTSLSNTADVLKKIEELEKRGDAEKSDEENEEKEGSKEKSKEGDEDEEEDAAEQEEYDEEEQEEENDYINSYFEDGDDFGAESDDNMDEATY